MRRSELKKVEEIAKKVREKVVKKYRRKFGNDLCGCCAIASGLLHTELLKNSITSKIAMVNLKSGGSHCFVIYKGYIVDVTASQFQQDDICIFNDRKHRNGNDWFWYGRRRIYHSAKDLRKSQLKDWPKEQICPKIK